MTVAGGVRGRIRVLVVDDSAYMRRRITRMLTDSPLVEVIDTARDGEDALRKTLELRPDLITLDLEMPQMDGFTFLRFVMSRQPTPVLVISGRSNDHEVFRALELGAADFIAKPEGSLLDLEQIQQELLRKVHAVRELRVERLRRESGMPLAPSSVGPASAPVEAAAPLRGSGASIVVIGSSTGGPSALLQIFGSLIEPPPRAFVVAQHMPAGFTRGFAERLDRLTTLRTREARDGDQLVPGTVLIAPGSSHLELAREGDRIVARVVPRGLQDRYAPSVDRLFRSAAKVCGPELLALVLTGMGDDGREGVQAVKRAGGQVIAEAEETAVVFGMPKQAIRTGVVDAVLPLEAIGPALRGRREPEPLRPGSSDRVSRLPPGPRPADAKGFPAGGR